MATERASAFSDKRQHAVYCWSTAASPRYPDAAAITRGLTSTFGQATAELARPAQRHTMLVPIGHSKLGWTVASWMVTHASPYGIHQVRFGGYQWRSPARSKGRV